MSDHGPYHNHNDVRAPAIVNRVEVTRVMFIRGIGCCEESPVRRVTAYYQDNGELITEKDEADE